MLEGPSYTGMAKEFIRAGQELGYEHVDLNARFEEGFDSIYSPMEMGERKASFHAFLEPVRDRETLSVRKYSRVTKVINLFYMFILLKEKVTDFFFAWGGWYFR